MEEYALEKKKPYNHFVQCRKTVRKLKDQKIIDKIMDRRMMAKMPWYRKLEIQKLAHGNPFSDRVRNSNLIRAEN